MNPAEEIGRVAKDTPPFFSAAFFLSVFVPAGREVGGG
jgi:hypothetical protein